MPYRAIDRGSMPWPRVNVAPTAPTKERLRSSFALSRIRNTASLPVQWAPRKCSRPSSCNSPAVQSRLSSLARSRWKPPTAAWIGAGDLPASVLERIDDAGVTAAGNYYQPFIRIDDQ